MQAQLLVILGCPSAVQPTEGVAFAGSPTILIDGEDIFEGAPRTRELSCRVYSDSSGLSGWPTADAIAASLRERLSART